MGSWKYVQVVPKHRDGDRSSFGNGQFVIHLPGDADDRFRERYDVIFDIRARHLYRDGVDPQRFLARA